MERMNLNYPHTYIASIRALLVKRVAIRWKQTVTRFLLVSCFLFVILSSSQAQSEKERAQQKLQEMRKLQEMDRKRAWSLKLDTALQLMNNEQYQAAEKKFVQLLNETRSVPSDLVYYFGYNSYFLNKYEQSIDWLNKYIQLKGTTGQFSEKAVAWKQRAEQAFLKQKKASAEKAQQILSNQFDVDCGSSGMVTCPVCQGTTVIVRDDYLKKTFKTCPYCDAHGRLDCASYNKLLKGTLKPIRK